jgi:hypothetical protein
LQNLPGFFVRRQDCQRPADQAGTNWCGSIAARAEILNGTWKFPEAQPVN